MSGLEIAAGVIGTLSLALEATRAICGMIATSRAAPRRLRQLHDEIYCMGLALTTLRAIADSELLESRFLEDTVVQTLDRLRYIRRTLTREVLRRNGRLFGFLAIWRLPAAQARMQELAAELATQRAHLQLAIMITMASRVESLHRQASLYPPRLTQLNLSAGRQGLMESTALSQEAWSAESLDEGTNREDFGLILSRSQAMRSTMHSQATRRDELSRKEHPSRASRALLEHSYPGGLALQQQWLSWPVVITTKATSTSCHSNPSLSHVQRRRRATPQRRPRQRSRLQTTSRPIAPCGIVTDVQHARQQRRTAPRHSRLQVSKPLRRLGWPGPESCFAFRNLSRMPRARTLAQRCVIDGGYIPTG